MEDTSEMTQFFGTIYGKGFVLRNTTKIQLSELES
jgi:hypothetical protein